MLAPLGTTGPAVPSKPATPLGQLPSPPDRQDSNMVKSMDGMLRWHSSSQFLSFRVTDVAIKST